MFKKIIEWPSKSLRKESSPIFKIDDSASSLAQDLIDTCKVMFGAGLAAPQIGTNSRMIVIKPSSFQAENIDPAEYDKEYTVMINPIIETSGQKIEWVEQCLSLPQTDGKVKRFETAKVTYTDLKGETKHILASWPFSGGLQHEIDHLDGYLYIQRQEKKKVRTTLFKINRFRRKEMIKQRRLKRMQNDS